MLSLLDQNQRPLFVPAGNGAFNAAGILQNVESQQIVGNMQGCPVVTDPNIPTTLNGSQDPIYVMRVEDLWLWETGIRARVLPETLAGQLTVKLQVYSYCAFTAGRYPKSIVEINGLSTPLFTAS